MKTNLGLVASLVMILVGTYLIGAATNELTTRPEPAFETTVTVIDTKEKEEELVKKEAPPEEVIKEGKKREYVTLDTGEKITLLDGAPMESEDAPMRYTVNDGDTLWDIAEMVYGSGDRWKDIYEMNKELLDKDDSRNIEDPGHWIYPDQDLILPEPV